MSLPFKISAEEFKLNLLNEVGLHPELDFLARAIEQLINYPVYFTNLDWDIYAQSPHVKNEDVITLTDLYESARHKSEKYVDYLEQKAKLNPLLEKSPAIIDVKEKKRRYLFIYAQFKSNRTGIIVFPEYEHPLESIPKEYLQIIMDVFIQNQAIHEFYYQTLNHSHEGWIKIFFNLLNEVITDEKQLLKDIQSESLITYITSYFVFVFSKRSKLKLGNKVDEHLHNYLFNHPGFHSSFLFEGNFVLVLNDDISHKNLTSIITDKVFINIVKNLNLYVGYSTLQTDLLNFKEAFEAAKTASKYARRWDTKLQISSYEECKVYDLLYHVDISKGSLKKYLSNSLIEIIKHDKNNETNYLKTLSVLLQNNLNLTHSAKELFIHKSTLSYRMKKMNEIFHIDWNNSNTIFHIHLSLYILKYFLI